MRVAIIGAGPSGLACAHELERLGVKPDIYERKDKVGELFPHVAALLQLTNRPIKDQIKHLEETYAIKITPHSILKSITMHSPSKSTDVSGNLGYLLLRGQDQLSLENQLTKSLQSKIKFNTSADMQKLSKEYDAVVIASGTQEIPNSMGLWKTTIKTWIKGAVVLGEFESGKMQMWVNTDYAKHGYGYLMPFNNQRATLCLIITDVKQNELDEYWHKFWNEENLTYKIVQGYELPYSAGDVSLHKFDNIYFVGNAGGFIEPLLGFGMFHAIISGVLAARSIVQQNDYDAEVLPLINQMQQMHKLRNKLNTFENKDYDKLINLLGMPGISQIIYNTNFDVIKYVSSKF